MIFTYEFGLVDAYRLCAHVYWGSLTRLIKNLFILSALWIFMSLLMKNFDLTAWARQGILRISIGGVLFAAFFMLGLVVISTWRVSHLTKSIGARRTMGFTRDGIDVSFGNSRAQHAWKGITRVEESAHGFYFYLTKRAAILFPKRALSSSNDLESLRRLLAEVGIAVR